MSRVQLPRPYGATKKKRITPTLFNANAATTNMHRHFTAIERQYEDDLRPERQEADRLRTEVECLTQALANACSDRGVTPPHPATSHPPMPTRMPSALELDEDWLNSAMEALTADLNAAPIDSVWGGVAMVAESPDSVLFDLF